MKRRVYSAKRDQSSSGIGVWSIIGGIALVAVASAVVWSYPDIQRYIKIKRM